MMTAEAVYHFLRWPMKSTFDLAAVEHGANAISVYCSHRQDSFVRMAPSV